MTQATHPEYVSPARIGNPAYQGYQKLHWAFVAAPVVAGVDKFANLLTTWSKYLAPALDDFSPYATFTTVRSS